MTGFNTGIDRKKQASRSIDAILLFFLRLYKLQIGADPGAESRVERMVPSSDVPDSDRIYTLRVNHQGTWRSRRMTIGQLGANIANKSLCYRVIFDDLMVVKIPPQPIHEFNSYIESIRRDWRIARKAAPAIHCIIPSLAALLYKIPRFQHPDVQTAEEMEKRYIFLLRKDPSLQDYLKIGGSFAFFMNLAQYTFLNEKIEKIHDTKDLLSADYLKASDPLWDSHGIDPLRMADEDPAVFEMRQVLAEYESQIVDLLAQYDCETEISVSRRRAWLGAQLSGRPPGAGDLELPEAAIHPIRKWLTRFIENHRHAIDAYRNACRKEAEQIWMERNRGRIAGLTTGILVLLAKLKARALAVRDLKPENIFLLIDPESTEHEGGDTEPPNLGLIDLETAVPFSSGSESVEQPLRTGTPAFSTPSHLFPNALLADMLGDLETTFFLQDVYAAAGLVFFAATGRPLFEKTGRLLPEIVLAVQKSSLKDRTPADLFRHAGWVFWHNAADELRRQRAAHQSRLRAMKIHLPKSVRHLIHHLLEMTRLQLTNRTDSLLSSETLLKEEQRKQLAALDADTVKRQRLRLEGRQPGTRPRIREQIVSLLDALEYLKRLSGHHDRYRSRLSTEDNALDADDLVALLFLVVIAFMYRESWKPRNHPSVAE